MKASIRIPRIAAARAAERCHYVKISGARCGSPALHGQRLCYFHNRMRLLRHRPGPFPPLEDGASIQYALMCVLNDIREKRIDHRTAGLLLYGLQTASANLKRVHLYPSTLTDIATDDPGDLLADPSSSCERPATTDSRPASSSSGHGPSTIDDRPASSSSCSRPATTDSRPASSSSGHGPSTIDDRPSSPDDRLDINAVADPAYLKEPPATPGSRAATGQEIREEWIVSSGKPGCGQGRCIVPKLLKNNRPGPLYSFQGGPVD